MSKDWEALAEQTNAANNRLAEQLERITAQRDELLAAITVLVDNGGIGPEDMFHDARDAIAKCGVQS